MKCIIELQPGYIITFGGSSVKMTLREPLRVEIDSEYLPLIFPVEVPEDVYAVHVRKAKTDD